MDYAEDSEAETDMNVVMNDAGAFIELQGTAEGHAFRIEELQAMLELSAAASNACCASNGKCWDYQPERGRSMTMRKIVLATGNPGKVREFNAVLTGLEVEIVPHRRSPCRKSRKPD